MKVKLIQKDGYFGVEEDGVEVVQCDYELKCDAIKECEYFLRLNMKEPFLDFQTTNEEIEEGLKILMSQSDLTIYFVKHRNNAGWTNNTKKYLML